MCPTHIMDGDAPSPRLPPGLVLHRDVVRPAAQAALLALTDEWLERGRAGLLRGRSYNKPPAEWADAGQSRECVHFGVRVKCNKVDNAPVEPLPAPLHELLDALTAAGVLAPDERPDSCCINYYGPGAWLPPHVDSLAFARPFCTVSLLSAQDVVFGDEIAGADGVWSRPATTAAGRRAEGDGGGAGEEAEEEEQEAAAAEEEENASCCCRFARFTMPPGSALRVDGAAAGPVCKHALPRATARRVSLTFRRVSDATRQKLEALDAAAAEAASARGLHVVGRASSSAAACRCTRTCTRAKTRSRSRPP